MSVSVTQRGDLRHCEPAQTVAFTRTGAADVRPHGRRRPGPGDAPDPGRGRACSVAESVYLIRSKILKIGMYRAMIIAPTMPPRNAIISGSISAVSDSVVASTSWS